MESVPWPLPCKVHNFFSVGFKESISESVLIISAIPINYKLPVIFIVSLKVNIDLSETAVTAVSQRNAGSAQGSKLPRHL